MTDKRKLIKNVVIPAGSGYGKDICAEDFDDILNDFTAAEETSHKPSSNLKK